MSEADARAHYRQALDSGEHLFSSLRMNDVQVDGADLAVELEVDPALTGPRGALQGGLVATLADVVTGRIAMDGLSAAEAVVTTDLSIHYLEPIVAGPAHAVGTVLRRGRRSIVARADIYDGRDGVLAAVCTVAFAVVGSPGSSEEGRGSSSA